MSLNRLIHVLFPMFTARIPIESRYNDDLCIEHDSLYGLRISSKHSFQSGDYVEEMWEQGLRGIQVERYQHILILGLGGGSIVSVLKRAGAVKGESFMITAIEQDPVMIALARAFYGDDFCAKRTSVTAIHREYMRIIRTKADHAAVSAHGVSIVQTDANDFLRREQFRYSLIVIDLFHGFEVSALMRLPGFIDSVYDRLAPGGMILANVAHAADRLQPLWERKKGCCTQIQYKQNTLLRISS